MVDTNFLKQLPTLPGVYQMMDKSGVVLYVGKAKNLKKRVQSYFRATKDNKTIALLSHLHHVECTVTATETEALLLENNLIKAHLPKYNVLFRDDKSYPYLLLSGHPDFPRLQFYRGSRKVKGRLFGPYPSAQAVKNTFDALQKLFQLRSCDDHFFAARTRPCLLYQIKRCTAPCVGHIDEKTYAEDVKRAILFLEGKSTVLLDEISKKMEEAANALQFERAAFYRDHLSRLKSLQLKQDIFHGQASLDVLAAIPIHPVACVQILYVREGQVVGSKQFFPKLTKDTSPTELLTAFISQHYTGDVPLPKVILTSHPVEEATWLADLIANNAGQQIKIHCPQRGQGLDWVNMAKKSALEAMKTHTSAQALQEARMHALQTFLGLTGAHCRVECFDISHTFGEATVASCVVMDEVGLQNSEYRRFNIRLTQKGDDYAAMREVLTRRYSKEGQEWPQIVLIDGGPAQLKQAEIVFSELKGQRPTLISLAKGPGRKPGLEVLYISGQKEGIRLPDDSPILHVLQKIRDEAHRFAITAHRQQRQKRRVTSTLEQIPGVGANRRRLLLSHFGGLQQLQDARPEDIAKVPGVGPYLAKVIYDYLHALKG